MRNHVTEIIQIMIAVGGLTALSVYTLTQPILVVFTLPLSLALLLLLPVLLPAFEGNEILWIMVLSFPALLGVDVLWVRSFFWANLAYGETLPDVTMGTILFLLLYASQIVLIAEAATRLWFPVEQ